MRIDDPNPLDEIGPARGNSSVNPRSRGANSGTMRVAPDRADLSSVAGRLSEMLQPETARNPRISELREAVARDTYRTDAAAVSHALVENALSAKPRQS